MGQHDLDYRQLFNHRRIIRDLLREIVGERWVEHIDLDSAERVNTPFGTEGNQSRENDVVWKFQHLDGGQPVYVLLELESRPDPSMPVRFMECESLFYQTLTAGQPAAAWRNLPLLIPILLYNGSEPWNVATDLGSLFGNLDPAAEIYRPQLRYGLVDESRYSREELASIDSPVADLFRIETSRDWSEVRSSVHRLGRTVPPDAASLRRAFENWLRKVILPRFGFSEETFSRKLTLKELEDMLAESIDRWNCEIRAEGRYEGREEGRQEGESGFLLRLLRLKFGFFDPEIEDRVLSADTDRLLVWGERILTAEKLQDIFRD